MYKYMVLSGMILMSGAYQNTVLCYSESDYTKNDEKDKKIIENQPKENIEDVENRFNNLVRQIAASKVDDENTRLARAHVKRLDEIERLKKEQKYYDQKAKEYSRKIAQKNYSVDYMLGFYRGKLPAPCGIQLGKTTREEIIKKFRPKLDNDSLSISIYNPSGYKNCIKYIDIYFDENKVVREVSIGFDDDYFSDFVGRIKNAGYRCINYFGNGMVFQQKEMPFEITIKNSLFKNLTDVSYRVME